MSSPWFDDCRFYPLTRHLAMPMLFLLSFCLRSQGQGFGSEAGMSNLPEGILKYSVYARDTVLIGYNAKTASGGEIGTRGMPSWVDGEIVYQNGEIIYAQGAVIRGNLIAKGSVAPTAPTIESVQFAGFITSDSSVTLGSQMIMEDRVYAARGLRAVNNNEFRGGLSAGAGVSLGTHNTFSQGVVLAGDSIYYDNGFFPNTFDGQAIALGNGNNWLIDPAGGPGIAWGTPYQVPEDARTETFIFPTTIIDSSGTQHCDMVGTQIRASGTEAWSQALCNMGPVVPQVTPEGLQVLPPGVYGDFTLGHIDTLVLGEGIYHFRSLTTGGGNAQRILAYQPTGGRTQILVKDLSPNGDGIQIRPYDTAGVSGGTILLYTDGEFLPIGQFSQVWATILAPNALVSLRYAMGLFGQVFARKVDMAQDFDGNEGRYIPFYPNRPRVGIVGIDGTARLEGNVDSADVSVNFSMDHVNGLPVHIFFYTRPRTAGGAAAATAGVDYRDVRDSVVIAVGDLQAPYTFWIYGDTDYEPDEFFEVFIDSVRNGRLDTASVWDSLAVITIQNDDVPPLLGFATDTLRVDEGDSLALHWLLDNLSTLPASASLHISGTATPADHDLQETSLSVSAGLRRDSLVVRALADGLDEPDETLILRLRNPINATLGPDSVLVIIIVDKDPPVGLAESMPTLYVVREDTGLVRLRIELDRPSGWPVQYSLVPVSSSTVQSDDYTLLNSTHRIIPAGQLRDSVNLVITDDVFDEGDETLVLIFSEMLHLDPRPRDTLRITILANDPPLARDTTVELLDNAPNGYSFARLDMQGPNPPSYRWNLLLSTYSSYFAIDAAGTLSVVDNSLLDFNTLPSFTLLVELEGPVHRDSAVVTIELVNTMRPPVIANGTDTVRIRENSPGGTPLDTFRVAAGSGLDIRWSIIGGSGADLFVIDEATGIARVAAGAILDYEARVHYDLLIRVTNASGAADTLRKPVALIDVIENTAVTIVQAVTIDSVYRHPATLWINRDSLQVFWEWDGNDTNDIAVLQEGRNLIIRTFRNPTKDQWGADTLVVWMNTQIPRIIWEPQPPTPPLPRWAVGEVRQPGDTSIYVNDPEKAFCGTVQYINTVGRDTTVRFCTEQPLQEGANTVRYTFRDPYGNSVTDSLQVILDTQAPVVKIIDPEEGDVFQVYTIEVDWTVDGVMMDTLRRQGLVVGLNTIERMYVDLAGNIGRDTVRVLLDEVRSDMAMDLVRPLLDMNDSRVRAELVRLRSETPLRNGERYTLSAERVGDGTLRELLFGDASGQRPSTRESSAEALQLGPTLRIEARFPHVGGVNGAGDPRGGTLGDLLESMRTAGFDPGNRTLEEFVIGSGGSLPPGDLDTIPIWKNDLQVDVQLYDNLGQFVDSYRMLVEDIRHEYIGDEGVAVFFLSLEPDEQVGLRNTAGRTFGNGAYLMRGVARAHSTLQFNTPDQNKGEVRRTSETLLKIFGYRRPQ